MILGYSDYRFVGLFSDKAIAEKAGCVEFMEVDPEFLQKDSTVYALKVTVETYFGQDIESVYVSKSIEDSIASMSEVVSEENLQKAFNHFVDSLPEDDQKMTRLLGRQNPLGAIKNVNIALLLLEPDKIVD